jgi:hypothetical protein
MAAANTSLRVTELDFNGIKNNLITFLQSQDTFSDYNFAGSGMSVLMDLLAYNTYYNAYYLNMVANEAFLDTAQDRKNILSHAKLINYVPDSAQGAKSLINIKVTPNQNENQTINYIILNQYTRLIGSDINGINYPFATVNANTSNKVNGSFTFANVVIKQGEVITHQYSVNSNNTTGRYQIPSANVDTSTLVVTVQESPSNTHTVQYFQAQDLTEIQANSTVYFLEEDQNLNYTIYFGDGVLGQPPSNGNIIQVTYLDTVGAIANGIQKFIFTDAIAGLFKNNVQITTALGSYGGTDKEDIEAIRFRAPYYYTAQNRCVTVNDYESLVTKDFPDIQAVSVWGGEENIPPVYGKVYLSVKTRGYYTLTQLEKQNIKDYLTTNRSMLTVVPEIIDPEYIFILVGGDVYYNPTLTTQTSAYLATEVSDSIYNYAQQYLYNFSSTFVLSKLQNYIENADPAITASDVIIYLQNRLVLYPGTTLSYTVNFNTPIRKGDQYQKLYTYPQVKVPDASGTPQAIYFEEVPQSYTGIGSVSIVNPGYNYSASPTITITGDGTGATATALVVNGRIASVTLTNPGINYTVAQITITDLTGVEASLKVTLASNSGTLRSYYYSTNGQKVFVNNNAGTIDYLNGIVTFTALDVLSVNLNPYYDENVLTVNVVPELTVIPPLRNRLLAIDTNNSQTVQLNMVPQV